MARQSKPKGVTTRGAARKGNRDVIEVSIPKSSKYHVECQPLKIAVPFPKGKLLSDSVAAFGEDGRPLPSQAEVTGRWPDGSIRWLLVSMLSPLDGMRTAKATLKLGKNPAMPATPVTIKREGDDLILENGLLKITIGTKPLKLFKSVLLHGQEIVSPDDRARFEVTKDDKSVFTTDEGILDELVIEREGPVWSTVRFLGRHGLEGKSFIHYALSLHIWAAQPSVVLEYQIINKEKTEFQDIRQIGFNLKWKKPEVDRVSYLSESLGWIAAPRVAEEKKIRIEVLNPSHAETNIYCSAYNYWVDWLSGDRGVSAGLRFAPQNFPKVLGASRDGVEILLYPEVAAPLRLMRGTAKTHELLLLFHDSQMDLDRIGAYHYYFNMPPHPSISPKRIEASGVFSEFLIAPRKINHRIESTLIRTLDNLPKGMGVLNFGDEASAGYTAQDRGKGEPVWLNNEYDVSRFYGIEFLRTGEQRFFDAMDVVVRHWMDVDFIHDDENEVNRGGLAVHSKRHRVPCWVTPSHARVAGFFDFYHHTGNRESLRVGLEVSDNTLRWATGSQIEKYIRTRENSRELGWALYNLSIAFTETGSRKYLSGAEILADAILAWSNKEEGIDQQYTYNFYGRAPFMVEIAIRGLVKYHEITGDARIVDPVIREVDLVIERMVDWSGMLTYKEFPAVRYQFPQSFLFALAYAYTFTKDRKYLKLGLRLLEATLESYSSGVTIHGGSPYLVPVEGGVIVSPCVTAVEGQGFAWIAADILTFEKVVEGTNLLDVLDYRY